MIEEMTVQEYTPNVYIQYAKEVISGRALPDARDGLKPVQRRITYDAYELKLTPDKPYKKSARIVGDVLGKYHPHGDTSVYEAMVYLAQNWNMRYPLIDGHGNFGSVDGDGAAAMRYTEAKLQPLTMLMVDDLNKDTVDFVPNFDGEEREPTVLPTLFPNMVANGSTGIAVGMATSVPPHNLRDVYSAIYYILDCAKKGEETDIDEIITRLKAPDFPTGGIITSLNKVYEGYKTGRGSIPIRAKYTIEEGTKESIIFTEIPFKVNKQDLCLQIADLVTNKKIEGISDVRDESSKDGMRIVVELKKDANSNVVLNNLLKLTKLTSSFSMNMVVLLNDEPKLVNIKQLLETFIAHSIEVLTKKLAFIKNAKTIEIRKLKAKIWATSNMEVLQPAIKQSNDVIETIRIISQSEEYKSEIEFNKKELIAISEMKLRENQNTNIENIKSNINTINAELIDIDKKLNDPIVLLNYLEEEYKKIEQKFGDDRKTAISLENLDIDEVDMIEEENLVITIDTNDVIKSVDEDSYKSQNRGGKGVKATNENSEVLKNIFVTSNKNKIAFITNQGRCHVLRAFKIQKGSRTSKGRSIKNYLHLENDEQIVSTVLLNENEENQSLLFITKLGTIKRLDTSNLSNRRSVTKVITFKEDDSLKEALLVKDSDNVLIVTKKGQSLRLDMNAQGNKTIRPMGRTAAGVRGISLKDDDEVVDMTIINNDSDILTITEHGICKKTKGSEWNVIGRGGKGVTAHKISNKTGKIVAVTSIDEEDELLIATEQGLLVRLKSSVFKSSGRSTTGVKSISLNEDDLVSSITLVKSEEILDE